MSSTPADPFAVDEFVDAERVQRDVEIVNSNLQNEFVRQPGLVYFYTSMQAKAERQHSELKLRLEAMEAKVASNVRDAALSAGTKITVDGVKEQVRLHSTVVRAERALIKAKEVESTLKGVVEAMRHKRDSLQMLGFAERDDRRAKIEVLDEVGLSPSERWKNRVASQQQSGSPGEV